MNNKISKLPGIKKAQQEALDTVNDLVIRLFNSQIKNTISIDTLLGDDCKILGHKPHPDGVCRRCGRPGFFKT